MKIGQRISARRIVGGDDDTEVRYGELVYIFEEDYEPELEVVVKYYGIEAPERVFKPFPFKRVVIKQDNGTYFVAPVTDRWKFRIIYPDKKEIASVEIK